MELRPDTPIVTTKSYVGARGNVEVGTPGVLVEHLGADVWLVELWWTAPELEGGRRFRTFELREDEFSATT